MKMLKDNLLPIVITLLIFSFSSSYGQWNVTVNSLVDDEHSYAWDNPDTEDIDESRDGICGDEFGRCTLRAASDESENMNTPANITFSVSGTINLMDVITLTPGSTIDGGQKVELSSLWACMEIDSNTTVMGLKFKSPLGIGLSVIGNNNNVGIISNGNTFNNSNIGLFIAGNSNRVRNNFLGIDSSNWALEPNKFGMLVLGNENEIGLGNTVCGSLIAGIIIGGGEGEGNRDNKILFNWIGTNWDGDVGLGNSQGILINGSINNEIKYNTISGNTLHGIFVSGVPPITNSPLNKIVSNTIGLAPLDTSAVPNGNGIVVTNATWLLEISNNVIAGNKQNGILIKGINDTLETKYCLIDGNYIGVNRSFTRFSNDGGITVIGKVSNIWIGANISSDADPNTIAGNITGGIIILADSAGLAPEQVEFRKNKIYQNTVTNLLVSSSANSGIQPPYGLSFNGNTLAGIHQSADALIDVYQANRLEGPPSAYKWLGSTISDANGVFAFDINDPSIEAISVTASKTFMGTSSFAYLDIITGIKDKNNVPVEFSLSQNYPNPFNPSTTINYSVSELSFITIKVYDVLGDEIATLVDEYKPAGSYEAEFDASKLSSGVYFYQLKAGNYIENKKMVLMR